MDVTHCLLQCYSTDMVVAAYNLSSSSLHCLAHQPTPQSTEGQRTVWNIVWSSLTTIFACTWVSCHPNISFNHDRLTNLTDNETLKQNSNDEHETSRLKKWWKRRWTWPIRSFQIMTSIKILLAALIAPEFIVMWALRQYIAAKSLIKKFKGLTMAHAFFSLMGGFVITDQRQKPVHVLMLREISCFSSHYRDMFYQVEAAVKTDGVKARVESSVKASVKASITANKNSEKNGSKTYLKSTAAVNAAAEAMADTLATVALEGVAGFELFEIAFDDEMVLDGLLNATMGVGREVVDIVLGVVLKECRAEEICEDLILGLLRDVLLDGLLNCLRLRFQERIRDREILKVFQEDIRDKSKRDSFAKTFALAQTTWFLVQCIARAAQHLPLTEIELITCAYATLSAIIYIFWWDKPFRVKFPIMLRTKMPHEERREVDVSTPSLRNITMLAKFLQGSIYDDISFQKRLVVPTFYSGFFYDRNSDSWNFIAEIVTGAVFGGIHLFAWNNEFPTQIESWTWRVSAIIIVAAPPIAFMPISTLTRHYYYYRAPEIRSPTRILISKLCLPVFILLYIVARLAILVLSIVSLRKLPVGALVNVNWLTFIPHVD